MTNIDETAAADYALHIARERDVKFIRLWFSDILGALKGIVITVEELEDALARGVTFDGSAIQGFAREEESDMVAMPDASTFRILPWRPQQSAVARMFCDIRTPEQEPFEGDPRYVLKKSLEKVRQLGFQYYVGPELEFFYFRDSASTVALDHGDYFDQTPDDLATDLRRQTVLTLAEMGIPVKYSHHEVAPSQHEIDLQYTDALTMADNVMTTRLVVKEVALRNGVYATFMPKPIAAINGSGMHINLSLFDGDRNVFFDNSDPLKLSTTARSFIAGLLHHAPNITLVTNQWVNSYKRLVPGFEAPERVSWASVNRSDLIRIPSFKPGREDAVRLEYRAPDVACNPYFAFAVLLSAGLAGVKEGYDLRPAMDSPREESQSGKDTPLDDAKSLPGSLLEAIQLAENSDVMREALGDHVMNTLLKNKRIEWERYRAQVTDYEIKEYLPSL